MNLKKKVKGFFTLTRKSEGFTLVELIVVIAILAILAGVAVPAYNGYIKKADRSADDALLNEINTAFASACMANGEPNVGRTDGPKINLANKTIDAVNPLLNTSADIQESFKKFFEGEGKTFKVMSGLVYKPELGAFTEGTVFTVTGANGKTYSYVADAALAAALANSVFMSEEMGVETTLGIIDNVTGFASAILDGTGENTSAALEKLIADESFLERFGEYIGMPFDDSYVGDEDQTAVEKYMAAVGEAHPDNQAQLMANAAILYAAQNSEKVTLSAIKDLLGGDNGEGHAKKTILANLDGDTGTAMAQTSAAYSLYMGYLHTLEDTPENQQKIAEAKEQPTEALNHLDDAGFKAYINNSSDEDIKGFLSAMSMLGEAANGKNSDGGLVATDILNEGFNTDWMQSLLGQATK